MPRTMQLHRLLQQSFAQGPYPETEKLCGGKPKGVQLCICVSAVSKWLMNNFISNRGDAFLDCASLALTARNLTGLRQNSVAACSYSVRDLVTSSGNSAAVMMLAQVRPAIVVPMHVSTGTPADNASMAVECALNGKESRNRSASESLLKCSATDGKCGAKITRAAATPLLSASRTRLSLAAEFGSASQSTLFSVPLRTAIQDANVSGRILKLLLKQQKTKAFSGNPQSARISCVAICRCARPGM